MTYRILAFLAIFVSCLIWFALKPLLQETMLLAVTGAGWLGELLVQFAFIIVEAILFLEVILKISFLAAIQPFKPIQTTVENWPEIDPQQLQTQTKGLEKAGFVLVTDYTIARFKGLIRLMLNSEQQCYAEVFQVGKSPITVIIGSQLEQNYLIAANNQPQDRPLLMGYWYAFFRIPQHFYKRLKDMPAPEMFAEFLGLRQEITSRLNLKILPVASAAEHFQMIQNIRKLQRQRLFRKSIILSILDMLIFATNPKYEYLGEDLEVKL